MLALIEPHSFVGFKKRAVVNNFSMGLQLIEHLRLGLNSWALKVLFIHYAFSFVGINNPLSKLIHRIYFFFRSICWGNASREGKCFS